MINNYRYALLVPIFIPDEVSYLTIPTWDKCCKFKHYTVFAHVHKILAYRVALQSSCCVHAYFYACRSAMHNIFNPMQYKYFWYLYIKSPTAVINISFPVFFLWTLLKHSNFTKRSYLYWKFRPFITSCFLFSS